MVGLTQRMVSSGGDPMVFIALADAQEAQILKDNDAIVNERARTAANPAFNRPGMPGLLDAVQAAQSANHNVNAVLVQVAQYATAIIVVTHDEKIIPTFRRLYNIRDGRTVEEVQMAKAA